MLKEVEKVLSMTDLQYAWAKLKDSEHLEELRLRVTVCTRITKSTSVILSEILEGWIDREKK